MTLPTPEQEQAKAALAYIRQTMESASTFTALSGWGLVAVGTIGMLATVLAWAGNMGPDLRLWIPAAVVAIVVASLATVNKARRQDLPLWSGAFRKVVWVMAPALAAGAVLTFALARDGGGSLLPGTWLALYGAGVTAGGTFSVASLRWMGVLLLVLGAAALLEPAAGLALLGAGFGGLHVAVGLDIAWRHGG